MNAIERLEQADAVRRLRARDVSLFGGDPLALASVANRLGWTRLAAEAADAIDQARRLAAEARAESVSDVVLLGMGGSSLAALVMSRVLGGDGPRLHVLDTVAPVTVATALATLDPATTLYLVSSKSGGTIEPNALYAIFRAHADAKIGERAAGRRFVALTDPGSSLAQRAVAGGFRAVVETPPNVGGRFSALTAFGLVPAALIGADVDGLVARSAQAEARCAEPSATNPAAALAAFIADAHEAGADKLTIVAPAALRSFGLWAEQLVAESLGKQGTGVIPVVELADEPAGYGPDRAVVVVRMAGQSALEETAATLRTGHPVFEVVLNDELDLGAEFVRWEHAIALCGHLLGVNPFDEPNVAEAKAATVAVLEGASSAPEPQHPDAGVALTFAGGLTALAPSPAAVTLDQALAYALGTADDGDYIALLTYLPDDHDLLSPIAQSVPAVARAFGRAVCLELGPRYLHSTGQLHKGGPPTGVFVLVTTRDATDLPVPGRPFTLRTLHVAQAQGDLITLAEKGLRVLRVDLPDASADSVQLLANALVRVAEARADALRDPG